MTDVGALADYLRSVGDIFEHEIEGTWEGLVGRCVDQVSRVIEADGAFTITPSVGAFLCR